MNQFDITKHKFKYIKNVYAPNKETITFINDTPFNFCILNKDDAIAIAMHFKIISYERLDPKEVWGESPTKLAGLYVFDDNGVEVKTPIHLDNGKLYLSGEVVSKMDEETKRFFKRIPQSETTYKANTGSKS